MGQGGYRKKSVEYYQNQKKEFLLQIDSAIEMLRANNMEINKTSIATELGLKRQILNKDYIKEYLGNYPEFKKIDHVDPHVFHSETEYAELLAKFNQMVKANESLKVALDKQKKLYHDEKETNAILSQRNQRLTDIVIHKGYDALIARQK